MVKDLRLRWLKNDIFYNPMVETFIVTWLVINKYRSPIVCFKFSWHGKLKFRVILMSAMLQQLAWINM